MDPPTLDEEDLPDEVYKKRHKTWWRINQVPTGPFQFHVTFAEKEKPADSLDELSATSHLADMRFIPVNRITDGVW